MLFALQMRFEFYSSISIPIGLKWFIYNFIWTIKFQKRAKKNNIFKALISIPCQLTQISVNIYPDFWKIVLIKHNVSKLTFEIEKYLPLTECLIKNLKYWQFKRSFPNKLGSSKTIWKSYLSYFFVTVTKKSIFYQFFPLFNWFIFKKKQWLKSTNFQYHVHSHSENEASVKSHFHVYSFVGIQSCTCKSYRMLCIHVLKKIFPFRIKQKVKRFCKCAMFYGFKLIAYMQAFNKRKPFFL